MRIKIPSDNPSARAAIAAATGEALAVHRHASGMSQAELAYHVGIGDEAISRMERGLAIPAYIRFHDFAAVLGCGVAALALPGSDRASDEAAMIKSALEGLSHASRKRLVRNLVDAARYEKELLAQK